MPDTHRLAWFHLSPLCSAELTEYIENTCNAPVVTEAANWVTWTQPDIKEPYISLAKKILGAGYTNATDGSRLTKEMLKKSKVSGCVIYNHMFGRCAMSDITVIRGLRDICAGMGIPLLVTDGDCMDPTIDPCSTYTKVQAYAETLNRKKFGNYFGAVNANA